MQYDEARLKHRVLLADIHRLEAAAEWEQVRKMERLERSLRIVRARPGLKPIPAE
jgi:hypothetical protein